MVKKAKSTAVAEPTPIYERIREILDSARTNISRTVNTTQVVASWLVGREIVEADQGGAARADYGESLLELLSAQLQQDFGKGFSVSNLRNMRQFYRQYPALVDPSRIRYALSSEFVGVTESGKRHAVRSESGPASRAVDSPFMEGNSAVQALANDSWKPGRLHPNLSWTHYRALLRVESNDRRGFYEIEAIENCWSARELERQIDSLLFERLAKSKDKKGLLRLATRGHEISRPIDIFKDPMIIEFVGLPESPKLQESDLETALLDHLQEFLLELGKGFAFIKRQERITLDSDHFYVDLVFFHVVLKCFVLIDLKVGKLTHSDLGQMQLYVNYFDQDRLSPGDNPTLGLILCTDKNNAVVKYMLGADFEKKIFASRYKLHLPTEEEIRASPRNSNVSNVKGHRANREKATKACC